MLKTIAASPRDYSKNSLREIEWRMIVNKRVFVLLNAISLTFVLFGSILTTLVLSKQIGAFLEIIHSKDASGNPIDVPGVPNWYFFLTTGISSVTTLVTGLLNFFVIRDKIKLYTQKREDLLYEIVAFNNQTSEKYRASNREYVYYKSIAAIMGSQAIRKVKENNG